MTNQPKTTAAITCQTFVMFRLLHLYPAGMTCLLPCPFPSSATNAWAGPVRETAAEAYVLLDAGESKRLQRIRKNEYAFAEDCAHGLLVRTNHT